MLAPSRLEALGAVSAFITVALGAFGAHALRQRISADMLDVYRTGVTYQMFHALAIIICGVLLERRPHVAQLATAAVLFIAGTLLFSGSLYVLATTGVRWLGAVTPLGGLCFLAGWLVFAWAVARTD